MKNGCYPLGFQYNFLSLVSAEEILYFCGSFKPGVQQLYNEYLQELYNLPTISGYWFSLLFCWQLCWKTFSINAALLSNSLDK